MTTWEYRAVEVAVTPRLGEQGRPVNDHPISPRLSRMGAQGWELVATCLCDDPRVSVFVFKRPAPGVPAGATHEPLVEPTVNAARLS